MIIKQNKRHTLKNCAFALLCLLILLVPLFVDLPIFEEGAPEWIEAVLTWAIRVIDIFCILFLLYGFCYYVRELFSSDVLIEICDDYFYDHSSAIAIGKVRWEDIEDAYIKGAYFTVVLKHPEKYLEGFGTIRRLLVRINKKMKYGDICISPDRFREEAAEFLRVFQQTWERNR
ncbi:MAG: hypothetical protein IJW46_00560 [Clostridia bacterium]|nr:hypothetical protein [Clostridia bacterium]